MRWLKRLRGGNGNVVEEPKSPRTLKRIMLKALVGKIALTKTKMSMTGFVEVEGQIIEALSTNVFVQKGEWVRIIGEKFGRLIVEPCESQKM